MKKTWLGLLFVILMVATGCGATITFQPVVSGYYPPLPYYYHWTPGHVVRVCEWRSTGTICFDRWIAHPLPGHYHYWQW